MNTVPLRIAIVSNTAWNLFNFRLNLIQQLQAAAHTVLAVAPDDAYADKLRAAGVQFLPVPISSSGINPFFELWSVWCLRTLFKRHGIDLVLSYTPKGNLYAALACMALGVPFVPNVSGLGRAFIRRSAITWVALSLYRLTFRRANHVFFQNADDLNLFLDAGLVRPARAERLPGSGVDLVRFAPCLAARRQTGDAPVFLLIARMLWDKGVGEYVSAARMVRARFPRSTFFLLGDVASNNPSAISREQVEEWVAEGVVTYLGSTDDVRPHLAKADCVVLPSYREGVPRVLLEAAAMARPLITTDAPGCRDAVADCETGFLCQPRDAEDLSRKMSAFIRLTDEQRHTMGDRGRAFVEEHFDEQLVVNRYQSLVTRFASSMPSGGSRDSPLIEPEQGARSA